MPDIPLTEPINPAPFTKIWIDSIVISGSPSGKTRAIVHMRPFNGTTTLDDKRVLQIDDVFALAGSDPQFAGVVGSLMGEIARLAALNNII